VFTITIPSSYNKIPIVKDFVWNIHIAITFAANEITSWYELTKVIFTGLFLPDSNDADTDKMYEIEKLERIDFSTTTASVDDNNWTGFIHHKNCINWSP